MHTDPIADLLTRIRNAAKAHHESLSVPHSNLKENVLNIMKAKGIIEDFKKEKDGKFHALFITLKDNTADLTFKRVSKPGQRIYVKKTDMREIKSGLGLSIISTSKGLMTNMDARKQNLGGELICEIY